MRVSCKTLEGDLNVIWDNAAKGAERTEEACLLSMQHPGVVEKVWVSCQFTVRRFRYVSNV